MFIINKWFWWIGKSTNRNLKFGNWKCREDMFLRVRTCDYCYDIISVFIIVVSHLFIQWAEVVVSSSYRLSFFLLFIIIGFFIGDLALPKYLSIVVAWFVVLFRRTWLAPTGKRLCGVHPWKVINHYDFLHKPRVRFLAVCVATSLRVLSLPPTPSTYLNELEE